MLAPNTGAGAASPPLPTDLLSARAHARLSAEMVATGTDIGAHDRPVAATAIAAGSKIATANVRRFNRVADVEIVLIDFERDLVEPCPSEGPRTVRS